MPAKTTARAELHRVMTIRPEEYLEIEKFDLKTKPGGESARRPEG